MLCKRVTESPQKSVYVDNDMWIGAVLCEISFWIYLDGIFLLILGGFYTPVGGVYKQRGQMRGRGLLKWPQPLIIAIK